jgi:hypothetical protein
MKKLIITESQYRRLINEQEDYTEQLLLLINSNTEDNLLMVKEMLPGLGINLVKFLSDNIEKIEKPYFYKFERLGINSDEDHYEVFKNKYGTNYDIVNNKIFINGNQIYDEDSKGTWMVWGYNEIDDFVTFENSTGYFIKKVIDENGNWIWEKYDKNNITESKRLKEQRLSYEDKVSNVLEKPYVKNMEEQFGITEPDQIEKVFKFMYGQDIRCWEDNSCDLKVDNINNQNLYWESLLYQNWGETEYDENGKPIFYDSYNDGWTKYEYDENGNMIYREDEDGYWKKYKYNKKGDVISTLDSYGRIFNNRNITESKRLKEQEEEKNKLSYNEKVSKILEPPYFHNMEEQFGITDTNDQLEVLKYIYENDITTKGINIYDSRGNEIYHESSDGDWGKSEYDSRGNQIYHEDSDGDWEKWEYDSNGNKIYEGDSEGYWEKNEFDSNGNEIYSEFSNGNWYKREFDSNGNNIYWVNNDGYWRKFEYDSRGNCTYYEDSEGSWMKSIFNKNGKRIYFENSDGEIEDNR